MLASIARAFHAISVQHKRPRFAGGGLAFGSLSF
jgi:hypothetical protein